MLGTETRPYRHVLHLSRPVGAAVGLGLAVVMLAPLLFLSKLAGMQFLAVQLGFIGGIYFGFGVSDGRLAALLAELVGAGVFLLAAAVALWADSPAVLAGAYAAHGLWDAGHHPRAMSIPVRAWYPPFCAVFDLLCAAFVLLWLPLGGVA